MKAFSKSKLMTTAAVFAIGLSGPTFADETWQKLAGVGAYASDTQDWTAIEAAAREDGQVVIYSVSSRIACTFFKHYIFLLIR